MLAAAIARPMQTRELASPDLAIDLSRFATTIDTARLDAAVVTAAKTNILDTLSARWRDRPPRRSPRFPAWSGSGAVRPRPTCSCSAANSPPITRPGSIPACRMPATMTTLTTPPCCMPACRRYPPRSPGQLRGALSGPDLIAAVAAGIEVTCRLGIATKLDLIESGFIYSSLLGYFGATAAAGRALGLTEAEMLNAFGIVYSSAAGNHQVTRDASLMKRLQPALPQAPGAMTPRGAGFAARRVFRGADGFFRVYLTRSR